MQKHKCIVVEKGHEAVLYRVDPKTGDAIDGEVEMGWEDLRQHVIDIYNDYAEKHRGTCPDFFIDRFAELDYGSPICVWIGSKSPLVYHILGRPGMVTIGCAALALGRALNHGWAILATPEVGAELAGWWPNGWTPEAANDAEIGIRKLESAGSVLDEIMELDDMHRRLWKQETSCRYQWTASSSGISYESNSRYTFYARGEGRCYSRLIVRTSKFGPVYIDLDHGKVSVEMEPSHREFNEAYNETWVPDQMERYIQELMAMGARPTPSATSFLEVRGGC